jgi:flagellar basal body-associated protein FliL
MKSCFGTLLVLLIVVAVLGTGGLIWYLSSTAAFTRKDAATPHPPVAAPASARPPAPKSR